MTALGVFRDDFYNPIEVLPQAVQSSSAGNITLSPAQMLGGQLTVLAATTATALTTATAAALYAAAQALLPNPAGVSYILRISATGAGMTLTGGAGVTISGTATVATNTYRDWLVTLVGPTSVTLLNIGAGTI